MRRIIASMLHDCGLETIEAGHGREGLQQLASAPPVDIALVDWNMPEMNGLDFVKAVRAQPRFAALPLVMVTTETEMERVAAALDAGANEYVMKPFGKEALQDKLALLGIL
jgi:two-component system chemotaxis response regulator CheY